MNALCNEELNDVISKNKNLIYDLLKHYDYRLHEDLFQVGVMGVIDAYKHYDSNKNTKFTSYAYPYIVGEMKKFIRENRCIRISRDIIYLCSRIERTKELLRQKMNKEPTTSDLSAFLEISEEKISEALKANNYISSIDEPINDDGKELTIQDVVSEKENYDKLDLISLRDELTKLSIKEKEILNKRYFEDKTQSETASLMGISQVEVSRSERKLILSLKNKLQ